MSGKVDDSISWRIENNTLIFSNSGEIFNYNSGENPWDKLQCENGYKNPASNNMSLKKGLIV